MYLHTDHPSIQFNTSPVKKDQIASDWKNICLSPRRASALLYWVRKINSLMAYGKVSSWDYKIICGKGCVNEYKSSLCQCHMYSHLMPIHPIALQIIWKILPQTAIFTFTRFLDVSFCKIHIFLHNLVT